MLEVITIAQAAQVVAPVAAPFFDMHITAGNVIEICVIAGGGLLALSRFTTKFALLHADLAGVKTDVVDMKVAVQKVNEVLVKTNDNARRISRIEDTVHELARGNGWVTNKRKSLDGEYPLPPETGEDNGQPD